ncbi:MAG TPA: helix-turn-helix domain-containing protein [Dermatophilaceae bacterium]|nr:helix-turn-helix domain-containing protein [Dermatophilaceae bacterium]
MEEKLLLRVEEVAELLNIGRPAVYDLIRLRTLTSVTIGRSRRIPVAAVRAYVARISEEAESA